MNDETSPDKTKHAPVTHKEYSGSAGGWGALASTAKHLVKSENIAHNVKNLLKTNQHQGFDCPGCAWGEKEQPGRFRFCENGAKAVNWEATSRRVDRTFFAQHSVSWLRKQSGYFLEYQGRLSEPLSYDPQTDHYRPISWQDAFALIAKELNDLSSPDQAEFYTSGRASNEAAFLYQLFVRKFGSNNFPDCSNMCHEASGYAMTRSIGVGKGTVTMKDFESADAIFVFGQNPGTNHPRMLDTLAQASRRGAKIVTFNPLKERGLERFTSPQSPVEMLGGGSTQITSTYFTPKLGGDMAAVRGMVKVLLKRHQASQAKGESVFDLTFMAEHTGQVADYLAAVEQTDWAHIIEQSGLEREQITHAADLYQQSKRVIFTWAMGITQHRHAVATIQEFTNLQLLFGQLGKPGAGLCPVRGHSNVQGDRTMGITEKPAPEFLQALEKVFGFTPPAKAGHNTVHAIQAMLSGQSKIFIALGGNFAAATPDTALTEQALANCRLTVSIATKLNRTQVIPGRASLILPCLGRTDIDRQSSGEQRVTVEDSFSMVHASQGVVASDTANMRSEPSIIAGMADATLGNVPIDWAGVVADYDRIRDLISATLPAFKAMNSRIKQSGGFYLGNSAAKRQWHTATGKAQFMVNPLPQDVILASQRALTDNRIFVLQTLRSHDQYNTTIYGFEDRYRGISGDRKVVMMHRDDMQDLALAEGESVDIEALWPDDVQRKVSGFRVITYDIPKGNAAAYFPETNPLVALASVGEFSDTPTSKSIAVVISKSSRINRPIVTG